MPATRTVTLTWNNDHSLVLTEDKSGVKGILKIRKKNGKQDIPFKLPKVIELREVEEAWSNQRENWISLFTIASTAFISTRVIRLPQDGCIVWNVLHINDTPFDTCGYTDLTLPLWETCLRELETAVITT